jgi:hypothetical protein
MHEDSLECAICADTPYPCEVGHIRMFNVDAPHTTDGVRYAISEEQARLCNASYWKHGLALIPTRDGSYELFDSLA